MTAIQLDQSRLNLEQIKFLNKANFKNKKKFENLTNEIFLATNKKPKWAISPILSRDFVQSRFFEDLNFLGLLDYYVSKKKIKYIRVNNFYLRNIIKNRHKNLNIDVYQGYLTVIKDFYNLFTSLIKILLYSFFMLTTKKKSNKEKFKNKEISLIETFFSKNLISNNSFQERYHKTIYSKLPLHIKNESFFFPINFSIFHIRKFLNIIKKEKIKFIHPMDFLEIKDYYESIFILPSLSGIHSRNLFFQSYNISKLVKYYHFISYFNFSSFLANLNFNFLKRLKNNNTKINLIIDWYENQIIDKGLCLGKNIFYPKTIIKGHMGFINDFRNIHYYTPIYLEKKLNVLPSEILLISKKIHKIYFKKLKFIKYKFVPAIRNAQIFDFKFKEKKKLNFKKNILIVLSANTQESTFIFKLLESIWNKINFKKFNFIIKTHSNTKLNSFIKRNKNLLLTKKDFYSELQFADIIISGGTTATIEANILNKKIILIGNDKGITLNPLLKQSEKNENICYDSKTLLSTINKLSKLKDKKMINNQLMNSYFIKLNKKDLTNFYK